MNRSLRTERLTRGLLAAYIITLAVGTHLPIESQAAQAVMSQDKVLHLAAYAVLGCLAAICLTPQGGQLATRTGLCIWAAVITFGAIDELTQPFFLRSCDFADWIADCLGAAAGVIAYGVWTRFRSS